MGQTISPLRVPLPLCNPVYNSFHSQHDQTIPTTTRTNGTMPTNGFDSVLPFVLPFLRTCEYIKSLSRCSKYHYSFLQTPEIHSQIIEIIQSREFFALGTFPPIHDPQHVY